MSILANLALASSLLTSNISLASNILNTPTNYDPCSISEQNIRANSNSTYSSYVDSLINQNLYSTSNATITVLTHGMAGTSEKHAINKITGRCVKCNIEILTPSQITKPEIQLNN